MLLLDVKGMLLEEAVLTVEVVAGASICSPAPASSWMMPWLMSWGAEAASTECRSCSTTNSPSRVSYNTEMLCTVTLSAREEQEGCERHQVTCSADACIPSMGANSGV